MIDKETVLCISLAARPSGFGMSVHNAGYKALGLNYLYKAFGITDLEGAIIAVRALNVRGCSISMPFKEDVVRYLDEVEDSVQQIGAVNTVVNDNGWLKGYNTDAVGAQKVLSDLGVTAKETVVLLGAGGVAKAILFALLKRGVSDIILSNRTLAKAKDLAGGGRFTVVDWEERRNLKGDLLINATSIGMAPEDNQMPVPKEALGRFGKVMDVVVTPMESRLIREAKSLGKFAVQGFRMSLQQAAAQFELYTGHKAPLQAMEDALNVLLAGKQ